MNLLEYFVEDNSGELSQLKLNEEQGNEFLESLPEDFCINYIRKSELEQKARFDQLGWPPPKGTVSGAANGIPL